MNKNIPLLLIVPLVILSCLDVKQKEDVAVLPAGIPNSVPAVYDTPNTSSQIATFLTFQKEDAEEAMNFYIGLFENSAVVNLKRWGSEGPGKEGTVMHATFTLNGKLFMCSDSPAIHNWDFTPAVSNYVECPDENALTELFARLSENGQVMMPLDNYGFSQKFGFVVDRFGVSWQLNLM